MAYLKIILVGAGLLLSFQHAGQSVRLVGVQAAMGVFSITDTRANGHTSPYSDSPWTSENANPIVAAGFSFFETGMAEFGIDLGYQEVSFEETYRTIPTGNGHLHLRENIHFSVFTFTPRVQLNWVESADNLFMLYSNANFGLSFVSETHGTRSQLNESYPEPSIHLSLIGMRFGDKIGGFFEFGVGYRGLISAGISMRP